jgi:hypothetical protein
VGGDPVRTAARKSRLAVSQTDIAALVSFAIGAEAGRTVRYGARFEARPNRVPVAESAWHPATRLEGNRSPRRPESRVNDKRGSAEDRRRRKVYLLNTYGNGLTVPCAFCKEPLMFSTLTVDRFPIPGRLGGRYTRDNIRPACLPCNSEDGRQQVHGRPRRVAA